MTDAVGNVATDLGVTPAAPSDPGALTLDAIWKMDDKQATAAIEQMAAQFRAAPAPPENSPDAARERLTAIQADPKFLAEYFSGNADRRREFDQLMERAFSDRAERLLAGATIPTSDIEAGIAAHDTIAEINRERALGIGDDVIAQGLRTEPLATRVEYDGLKQYQRDLLADQNWTQRWLSGDPVADREWRTVQKGLVNGYKGAP